MTDIPPRTSFDEVLRDLEVLKILKKQKDLRPALVLALSLVNDAERMWPSASGEGPPPAYTEQAAIILRKMKDYQGEVDILERYQRVCQSRGGYPRGKAEKMVTTRLAKARELRDEAALSA